MKCNRTLILKSIIYRPYSEFVTFLIALAITGQVKLSAYIGLSNLFVKIFSYFIFDKVWNFLFYYKYKPCVVWMTGLSGAGKTTISTELYNSIKQKDVKCIILDGDEIRNAFGNVGFDKESRIKHNINVGYIASLLENQGYIVIVSLISPYFTARASCRSICKNFIEVYVSTPLDICEKRDVKGLYKKARLGEIKEFTGISSEYQPPPKPELTLDTSTMEVKECSKLISKKINQYAK